MCRISLDEEVGYDMRGACESEAGRVPPDRSLDIDCSAAWSGHTKAGSWM